MCVQVSSFLGFLIFALLWVLVESVPLEVSRACHGKYVWMLYAVGCMQPTKNNNMWLLDQNAKLEQSSTTVLNSYMKK